MSKPITVAIAGSTERTRICAEALHRDPRFEVCWILTPSPKILGRKKVLTQNPVHNWADQQSLNVILLEKRIDEEVKNTIESVQSIDFLLVVDFGYLVPKWLLDLPQVAALNIHPSLLPRWRGSSPGQFVLLYGEKESAVTLMQMDEGLDSGPIIAQLPFTVQPTWTQKEYYQYSFDLIQSQLAELVADFFAKKLPAQPQPSNSPTPIAKRLAREDGYIPWQLLSDLMSGIAPQEYQLSDILLEAQPAHVNLAQLIAAACRAFSPWPGIHTSVTTDKGNQHLKIISCKAEGETLKLETVQLEGKNPTSWQQISTQIKEN